MSFGNQKLSSILFLVSALILLSAPIMAQGIPLGGINNNQIYEIRSVYESSKCIDIQGNSLSNGALGQIHGCHGGSNQRWQLANNGSGRYSIIAKHSSKCLDVKSASQSDGRNVQQYTCHGGTNQLWNVISGGSHVEFIAEHSGKCLETRGNNGGLTHQKYILEQRSCDNGSRQKWLLSVVAECGNGLCESAEGEGCASCVADCGSCPPPPPPPPSVAISGPTHLEAGETGYFSATVTGGVPPYTLSWYKVGSGLVELGSNTTVSTSSTESFNIICDVVDSAGGFGTSFLFVSVGGGGGGPIIFE